MHKALREAYGQAYAEGDVIGCLIHLPPGGRAFERDHLVGPRHRLLCHRA